MRSDEKGQVSWRLLLLLTLVVLALTQATMLGGDAPSTRLTDPGVATQPSANPVPPASYGSAPSWSPAAPSVTIAADQSPAPPAPVSQPVPGGTWNWVWVASAALAGWETVRRRVQKQAPVYDIRTRTVLTPQPDEVVQVPVYKSVAHHDAVYRQVAHHDPIYTEVAHHDPVYKTVYDRVPVYSQVEHKDPVYRTETVLVTRARQVWQTVQTGWRTVWNTVQTGWRWATRQVLAGYQWVTRQVFAGMRPVTRTVQVGSRPVSRYVNSGYWTWTRWGPRYVSRGYWTTDWVPVYQTRTEWVPQYRTETVAVPQYRTESYQEPVYTQVATQVPVYGQRQVTETYTVAEQRQVFDRWHRWTEQVFEYFKLVPKTVIEYWRDWVERVQTGWKDRTEQVFDHWNDWVEQVQVGTRSERRPRPPKVEMVAERVQTGTQAVFVDEDVQVQQKTVSWGGSWQFTPAPARARTSALAAEAADPTASVDVKSLGSKPTPESLNSLILQAKQEYDRARADGNSGGMEAAHRRAEWLRSLGGTYGADQSTAELQQRETNRLNAGIVQAKLDYATAEARGDAAAMADAHARAEALRQQGATIAAGQALDQAREQLQRDLNQQILQDKEHWENGTAADQALAHQRAEETRQLAANLGIQTIGASVTLADARQHVSGGTSAGSTARTSGTTTDTGTTATTSTFSFDSTASTSDAAGSSNSSNPILATNFPDSTDVGNGAHDASTTAGDSSSAHTSAGANMPPEKRVVFVESFFRKFSGTSWWKFWQTRYGYGQSILDFMQWETTTERLSKSAWWRAVNGQMIDDMQTALDAWTSGQRSSDNPQVDQWLRYMANPSSDALWAAHNASIRAGFKANKGLLLNETPAERQFALFVTLRVVQYGPGFRPDWPILKWVTNEPTGAFAYPQTYPAQYGTPSVDDVNWHLGGS